MMSVDETNYTHDRAPILEKPFYVNMLMINIMIGTSINTYKGLGVYEVLPFTQAF